MQKQVPRPVPKQSRSAGEFLRSSFMLGTLLLVAVAVLVWIGRRPATEGWWNQVPEDSSEATTEVKPHAKATGSSVQEKARASGRMSVAANEATTPSDRRAQVAKDVTDGPAGPVQNAMELIDKGQWAEAEKILIDYLRQHPKDEMGLIEMAMIQALDRKDSLAAQPYLQQALQVNPQNEMVVEELLRTYEETRSWEEGLNFLKSLGAEDSSAAVNYGIGSALIEMNRPAEAIEVLQKAVYENGLQSFDAGEALAQAYVASGRPEDALREYSNLMQGPYKTDQLVYTEIRMASTLNQMGRYAEARDHLEKLLKNDPSNEFVATLLRENSEKMQTQY